MGASRVELSDLELDNALEKAFDAQTAKVSRAQLAFSDAQPSSNEAGRPSDEQASKSIHLFGHANSRSSSRKTQGIHSFRVEGGAEEAVKKDKDGSPSFWAVNSDAAASTQSASQISFQFPDWGVDFSRSGTGLAHQKFRQDQRAPNNAAKAQAAVGEEVTEEISPAFSKKATSAEKQRLGQDPSVPGSDCYFHLLPNEVLWSIFGRLFDTADVCNCSLVCVRWEELVNGDEIWAHLSAEKFEGQEWSPGGAKMAFKRSTMLHNVARRFHILEKGFEYLAAALDAWWESPPPSDPQLPYSLVTVQRILGKLTASNWALLYEGLQALFIARADRLALELLTFLTDAQAALPPHRPTLQAPVNVSSRLHFSALGDSSAGDRITLIAMQAPFRSASSEARSFGSFSDDLLEAFGRSPSKRRRKAFQAVSHVVNQTVPISELVARAESEPDGQGWGRGLRVLAEAGVSPDDVAEALASSAVYDSVGSGRNAEALPTSIQERSEENVGNLIGSVEHATGNQGSLLRTFDSRTPVSQQERDGTLQAHPEGENERGYEKGAELERDGHVHRTSGTTEPSSFAEEPRKFGLDRPRVGKSESGRTRLVRSPDERKRVELERGGSTSSAIGTVRAGPIGAALWREVLKAWQRQRAFVLLVSEQCDSLNVEVLRERSRSLGIAATPTVFDQGALCFRGQILLRHKLRRPLQAGLAWLTMRAISGDATDEEYALLLNIKHMRQEIDVSDDFTLTKATFTQAKFRRCFNV